MDNKAIESRYQMKVKPGKVLCGRLKARITRLERRYEIPSNQMFREVRLGKMRETEEISRWMQDVIVLRRISCAKKKINR